MLDSKINDREYHRLHEADCHEWLKKIFGRTTNIGHQVARVGSFDEIKVGGESCLKRVRRPHHAVSHPDGFTLRTYRGKNGDQKSELDLLLEGEQDWIFYYYGTPDNEILAGAPALVTKWVLLSLPVLRRGIYERQAAGVPLGDRPFPQGIVLRYSDYPGIIIASWEDPESDGRLF